MADLPDEVDPEEVFVFPNQVAGPEGKARLREIVTFTRLGPFACVARQVQKFASRVENY